MPMPDGPPEAPPLKVAMLVYPGMVLLDLVGPQTILKILGSSIHLVAKTVEPLATDVSFDVTPTAMFANCPRNLDILVVPGGLTRYIAAMSDQANLQFLADRGATARYFTSVCTGGLVLGAARLLRGYRATAHWCVADLLPIMGAVSRVTRERVMQNRNRLTGAGTTAGLDFGLTLATLLRCEDAVKHVQLIVEYPPQPPFKAGTPDEVSPEKFAEDRRSLVRMDRDARRAAEAAALRRGLKGVAKARRPVT